MNWHGDATSGSSNQIDDTRVWNNARKGFCSITTIKQVIFDWNSFSQLIHIITTGRWIHMHFPNENVIILKNLLLNIILGGVIGGY